MISGASIFISIVICILIFGSELQDEIKNIQYLEQKVKKIGSGELDEKVSIDGQDEICQLAVGIDTMRNQLLEQKKTQEKMKEAQDALVLGMAHDMRTPLTGLFSYLEIIKKMEKKENLRENMPPKHLIRRNSYALFLTSYLNIFL